MDPQNNPQQPEDQQQAVPGQEFQAQQPVSMFQLEQSAPSKKKKILVTVIIVAAVLLVVTAALMYVFTVVLKPEPVAPIGAKKAATAVQAIEAVKSTVSKMSKEAVLAEYDASPVYQPSGYRYSVQYKTEYGATYTLPLENSASLEKQLEETLVSLGLEKSESLFVNSETVCALVPQNSETVRGGTVSCGAIKKYQEEAATLQPFADALITLPAEPVLSNLVIEESAYGGYKNAKVTVTGGEALELAHFYKKDSSSRWLLLVQGADEVLKCQLFTSVEMQRAFLNTPCLDDTGKAATVQAVEKRS